MKITDGSEVGSGSGAHAGATAPIPSILLHEYQIKERTGHLGAQISRHYAGIDPPLIILVVLDGAMVFAADLMRRIKIPFEVATITCKSYDGGASSGHLKITQVPELEAKLRQRQILLVEDIIDSGYTIANLIDYLPTCEIRIASLLERLGNDKVAAWRGFEIPAGFVYGYGLDNADGTGRGLRDLWVR